MALLYSSRPMTQQERRLASSSAVEVSAGWSEQSRVPPARTNTAVDALTVVLPPSHGSPPASVARHPEASPGAAAFTAEREAAAQAANELHQQRMDDLRTRQVQESLQQRQLLSDEENRMAGEAALAHLEAFKREMFAVVPNSCRVAPTSLRAVAHPPPRNAGATGSSSTPRPHRLRSSGVGSSQPQQPSSSGASHAAAGVGRTPSPRLAQLVTPAPDADLLPLLHHARYLSSHVEQPQQRHLHHAPSRSAAASRARSPKRVGDRSAVIHSPTNAPSVSALLDGSITSGNKWGTAPPVSGAEGQTHTPRSKSEAAAWMPVPFSASHFTSVLHWAELSFHEAVVAVKGAVLASVLPHPTRCSVEPAATSVLGRESRGHSDATVGQRITTTYAPGLAETILDRGIAPPAIRDTVSGSLLPSHLTTVATCAIVDEVMSQLPGFETTWRHMRLELFGAIFCLTPSDVASSLGCDDPDGRKTTEMSSSSATPANDGDHRRHPHQGDSAARKQCPVTPANWFSRVCAKRGLWAHNKLRAEDRAHALEQRLEEAKVSVTKHDRIFDVYSRSNDRVTLQRVFRVWRSFTVRSFNFLTSLDATVARRNSKGLVSRVFYAWHRHLLRLKLKYSSDKTTSFSAVQEAKLKAKAQELAALQAQLEQETYRLRQQSEKDTRKLAALVTSHEVEVRELQSLQEAKDQLVVSMEKIARRWERIAKTFRPVSLQRGVSVAGSVLRAAQALLDAERQLARGPTQVRLSKGKHALQVMLCEWVNATLDEIGSRAPRIKNTTSDLRDGESLLALCRHLVQKRSSAGQPPRGDGPTAAAAAPDSQLHLVHATVARALYLGTSRGLVPPLLSSSPRGSKIMARDGFLEVIGSTALHAGMWVLASLFVQEALETSRFSLDHSSAFHRWQPPPRVEHHVADVVDVSLMLLSDRSGPAWEDYPPLRLRRSLSSVANSGAHGNVRSGDADAAAVGGADRDSGRPSTTSIDPFQDTASDIDYYLGVSSETGAPDPDGGDERDDDGGVAQQRDSSDSEEQLSDGGGGIGTVDTGLPSTSSFGVLAPSANREAMGDRHGSIFAGGLSGDAAGRREQGQSSSSSPLVASMAPRTIQFEILGRQTSARFTEPGAATTTASGAFVDEDRRGTAQSAPDSDARVGWPAASGLPAGKREVPLPQAQPAAEVPLKTQTLASLLPPVRQDLRDCAMPGLVRKLRREDKALHVWTGLARLVTSVVLRFRVLDDVPSSSRQRGASLIPFSSDSAAVAALSAQAASVAVAQSEPMPPARAPSFSSRDRLGSFIGGSGGGGGALVVQQHTSSAVPRIGTADGPPRHRTGSVSRSSVNASRGAAFFPEDGGSATATPLLGHLVPAISNGSTIPADVVTTPSTGTSRRNTIKFN